MSTPPLTPNHHAGHDRFSGLTGAAIGLTLAVGRGEVARLAADLTEVGPGDRLVDVGCGPGTAVREAAGRGASATGVDPAPVMLRLARLLSRARPRTRARDVGWLEGTAEALPLPDASADVVWSIATVHHWDDLERGLSEAFRVLAPGGRFLAIEGEVRPTSGIPSGHGGHGGHGAHGGHGWTPEQADAFAALCRHTGFGEVAVGSHPTRRGGHVSVLATRPAAPPTGPSAPR